MDNQHNIPLTIAVLVALIVLFGFVGSGDYADALASENARLRGALSVCHAAQAVQP